MTMQTIYEAVGGIEGLKRLAHEWHHRVLEDEVVSHAFSHGYHPQHTERLAAYWAEALGGPMLYSSAYGNETSVVRLHSGNGPHEEMDARAIACFDQALEDIGLHVTDLSGTPYTTTSLGRRPRLWVVTMIQQTMCRKAWRYQSGPGTGS